MAEGARLESVYTFARIEGSNPSLTAKIISDDIRRCLKSLNLKGLGFFYCRKESDLIRCNPPYCGG